MRNARFSGETVRVARISAGSETPRVRVGATAGIFRIGETSSRASTGNEVPRVSRIGGGSETPRVAPC